MPAMTDHFAIGEKPSDARTDAEHVHHLLADQTETEKRVLGFPGNLAFDHSQFGAALSVLFNNVGDPDQPDVSDVGTKGYERAVVNFLAGLFGARPDETYGYVTSSGTAANEHGIFVGRTRYPDALLYYSDQAHYTVPLLADKLRVPAVQVPSGPDGAMNPEALADACAAAPGRPALVVATIETTMTGARDNVSDLRSAAEHHTDTVHLHVDGALGALVSALAPAAPGCGFTAGADTIAVSGHKLIGSPMPCGITLARRDHVRQTGTAPYCSPTNHTIGCSRSGLAALLLWIRLRGLGRDGLERMVANCLTRAQYTHAGLDTLGLHPHRHPHSITVTFDAPPQWVCWTWHLPVVDGRAHLVAVEHVTPDRIDELLEDIREAITAAKAIPR